MMQCRSDSNKLYLIGNISPLYAVNFKFNQPHGPFSLHGAAIFV